MVLDVVNSPILVRDVVVILIYGSGVLVQEPEVRAIVVLILVDAVIKFFY